VPPFTHWRLATGTDDAIRALGEALELDYFEEDRSFAHNLRTAILDTKGRLHRLFRGNEWTPEELVAELEGRGGLSRRQSARRSRVRLRGPASVTTTLSSTRTPPSGASASIASQSKSAACRPERKGRSSIGMK
jgi:hypothetical protein